MFTIDFFELAFLAEACIPPAPIARTMFWESLTNVYWAKMSRSERDHLYEWMRRKDRYMEQLAESNEYVAIFEARYNPANQYNVGVIYKNKAFSHDCFLFNGRFCTGTSTSILDDYIVTVLDWEGNQVSDWKSLLNRS